MHAKVHFLDRSRHGPSLHARTACSKVVTFPGSLGLGPSLPLRFGVAMLKNPLGPHGPGVSEYRTSEKSFVTSAFCITPALVTWTIGSCMYS